MHLIVSLYYDDVIYMMHWEFVLSLVYMLIWYIILVLFALYMCHYDDRNEWFTVTEAID